MAIPPRSLDLNPLENIFDLVKRMLQQDATKKDITFETYQEFIQKPQSKFH